MRTAFLIPHFFGAGEQPSVHGSHRANTRAIRRAALDRVIFQLHALFGQTHHAMNSAASRFTGGSEKSDVAAYPSENPYRMDFDVLVFTTGGQHLVGDLECGPGLFRHIETRAEPLFLGFECAKWIRDNPTSHDFYCYLEDDIIIRDPLFFLKIQRFNAAFDASGRGLLLQPQRYEESLNTGDRDLIQAIRRIYIDYQSLAKAPFEGETLRLDFAGIGAEFEPALNPHAGCYVLNQAQVAAVVHHPDFLSRDKIDLTPLDTAATSFVARALKVYKPARNSLSFLDVQHAHQGVMWLKYE